MSKGDFAVLRGSTVEYFRLRKVRAKRNPSSGPFADARWMPLTVGGRRGQVRGWNPKLRAFAKSSGVYVLRDRSTRTVVYVGESHTGRLYRTLLHHFHDPKGKFESLGEWVHHAPGRLEVLLVKTSAAAARDVEAEAVAHYEPLVNKTYGGEQPADVPF